MKYKHPMPPSKIPFMPKICEVREVIEVFWESLTRLIFNVEVFTIGVPKSDTFTVRIRSIVEESNDGKEVKFSSRSYLHFKEFTFLQSVIEQGAIEN